MKIQPQYNGQKTPLRHTWSGLVNIDQFRHLLRRDAQDCVKQAHDEIGARHVRAAGMFDHYLGAFDRDPRDFANAKPTPRANWRNVFFIIDQLLESGVQPMFTTCFTPPTLARKMTPVFGGGGSAAPPSDYKIWSELVVDGARHSVQRYGENVVKNWLFEAWNEPNLGCFFDGTREEFWELWAHTYRALKSVNADFQVGGPSTARAEWLGEFLDWTRKNDCEPDYLISHVYNNDSESAALSPFDGPQAEKQNRSPHFASRVMRGARNLIDEMGFKGELHWNEWGRSWLPCDPIRESAHEAAFIAKTMAEVSQTADKFAYWCLSDVYDQAGYGREAFHGNYGMISLDGLKKPSYFAHQLLEKLGDQQLETRGETTPLRNALTSSIRNGFAVLIYAIEEDFEVGQSAEIAVEIELPQDFAGKLKLWRIGENENNIVRDWNVIGAPVHPSHAQTQLLRERNALQNADDAVSVRDNCAIFSMRSPGVALLEIAH